MEDKESALTLGAKLNMVPPGTQPVGDVVDEATDPDGGRRDLHPREAIPLNLALPPPSLLEVKFLGSIPAELQGVVLALRKAVLKSHPDATVLCWPALKVISFGFGPRKMSEHDAFIQVHAAHVNPGLYHGASLPADGQALEGTGKALRHVKAPSARQAASPAMAALIGLAREHQACRLNIEP